MVSTLVLSAPTDYHSRMDAIAEIRELVIASSLRKAAEKLGCSKTTLDDILCGRRNPGDKVLDGLKTMKKRERRRAA